MMELARVEVQRRDGATVARIIGEVDASNGEDVGKHLDAAFEDPHGRHVVDLTQTEYLDSVGLRLLFVLAERLRVRGRELDVVVPENGVIRRLLVLTDLSRFVRMHSSLDDVW